MVSTAAMENRASRVRFALPALLFVLFLVVGVKPAMAGTAEDIAALPTLDAFNRSEAPLSNGGRWSALFWDNGTAGFNTGRVQSTGWSPFDPSPAVNGAFWNQLPFGDSPGSAASITMPVGPGAEKYGALWLDMPNPAGAKSGYQLRWANTSGSSYSVSLSKWSSGIQSPLASNGALTIPAGSTLAISDTGGTVQAWQGSGGSLSSVLSAADATFSSGYAGIESSDPSVRFTSFEAGSFVPRPDTTISAGPKGITVPAVSFSFGGTGSPAKFECALDAGAYSTCTSPRSYSGLGEASHTFRVRGINAGGPDETPAERSFQVVTAAKAASKTPILDNFERSEVPLATGKFSKIFGAVGIGGAWMGSYRGYGSGGGLEGAYWNQGTFGDGGEATVLVAGNVGTGATPEGQFLALWLSMPEPGTARSGYEARFTGGGSATTYKVEIAKWVSGTRNVLAVTSGFSLPVGTTMALTETAGGDIALWTGTTTLSQVLSARDTTYTSGYAGLEVNGGAGTIYNFRAGRIDLQAPETTIQSGPSGPVLPSEVTFAFTSNEAGSTFECMLDSTSYATCGSPKAYSGLAAGPHSFKVRALDAVGNQDATPSERSFEVVPPPTATTNAATEVKATTATLKGSVNPKGAATTYRFEYGTTTVYGKVVPATPKSVGAGTESIEVSEPLTGLEKGITYHYRLVATNGAGTTKGEDRAFTTATAPVATAAAASGVSATEATLNASVNPKGAATTYQFEYGTTTAYGSKAPATAEGIGSGQSAVPIAKQIGGLTEGTTYHYRVVAKNEVATVYGADQSFSTPFMPDATTEPAAPVGPNEAVLQGTVDPNGSETEYHFEYGTTTSYGSTIAPNEAGGGTSAVEATESIPYLKPETTYHYRLVADSPAGEDFGQDKVLTTGAAVMTPEQEAAKLAAESATSSAANANLPYDFFGMMWTGDWAQTTETRTLSAVKNSGARMYRLLMNGVAAKEADEKAQQEGKASNQFGEEEAWHEKVFREASKRGITILPGIGGGKWPTDPAKHDRWKVYAREMVDKYGPNGSFWGGAGRQAIAWEIWNEPNLAANSPYQGTSPGNPKEEIKAKDFGALFHKIAEGVNEGSAAAEVLAPGLFSFGTSACSPDCHLSPGAFLEQMERKGDYDAVSLHPYVFKVGENPHAPDGTARPKDIDRVKEKVRSYIEDVRNRLKSMGTGSKPIWVTELGFPVENRVPDGQPGDKSAFPPVSEQTQKEEIEATFGMMKAARDDLGIAHAFYYNIQDYRDPSGNERPGWDYHSGLRRAGGGNRPGWRGFATVTPKGHPNWPSAKKAQGAATSSRASQSATTGYTIETEGARYLSRAEYGAGPLSSSYPSATGWQVVEAGPEAEGEADVEPVNVGASTKISGLTPNTQYHYRVAVKDENGNIEYEPSGHEFKTKPVVESNLRSLNGEPGWINVWGTVNSETPVSGVEVNINFKKKEGGEYVFKPSESTHAMVTNGSYSLVNWRIGKGEWQVNVVFPGQGSTPSGETGLTAFTMKNAYQLVNRNSGKCLQIASNSMSNGGGVHQWECGDPHTKLNQDFTLVPSPSNPALYQLVARHSNKCLDVINADQNAGAGVQQYSCLGWSQNNQVWEGIPVEANGPDNSWVKFVAKHSNKCLEIQNSGTGNGAVAVQNNCDGRASQQWTFLSVEGNQVPLNAGITVDEVLYGHPGYVTYHGNIDAGGYDMSGQWVNVNFQRLEGGEYKTVTGETRHDVLTPSGGFNYTYWGIGTGDWRTRVVFEGAGPLAEDVSEYRYFHVGDGYRFEFRNSGKCLSTSGGGTGNGTAILQWDCSPSPNPGDGQVYSIVPVNPVGSSEFTVRPDSNTNMCLDVSGASTANGAYLQLYQCLGESQSNQIFHILPLAGQTEWFASIARHSNKCWDVIGQSTNNGARIDQWECWWGANQQWRWHKIG
jgi:hypothetical protein